MSKLRKLIYASGWEGREVDARKRLCGKFYPFIARKRPGNGSTSFNTLLAAKFSGANGWIIIFSDYYILEERPAGKGDKANYKGRNKLDISSQARKSPWENCVGAAKGASNTEKRSKRDPPYTSRRFDAFPSLLYAFPLLICISVFLHTNSVPSCILIMCLVSI